jgi:ankyrin repeat protein
MASERRVLEGVLAAARDGNVQAMKERIDLACSERSIEARELLDQFKDANGCSAAHMAAAGGHMAVLHYLRDAGADLSGGDAVGHTPLYAAAAAGRHDVVRMLASVDNMPVRTVRPPRVPSFETLGDRTEEKVT